MKGIISIRDIDEADFIIKWRMTEMCNGHCSYCIRPGEMTTVANTEKIKEVNKRMAEVALQINRLLDEQPFHNVKIDLIGGEVSILDLQNILSNLKAGKIKRINITTNLLREADYYIDLAKILHEKEIQITITASFHYEMQSFEKYFEKIEKVRPYIDILACEMVSNINDQDLVVKFIDKCKEIGIDYQVEGDLRFDKLDDRRKGLIIDSSKKSKTLRYIVKYDDGTMKTYITRNSLLMDPNNGSNRWQMAIHTNGMYCTQSYNYFYLEYDHAVGRNKYSDDCKTRMPIEEFRILKPKRCPNNNCTLCGHMSLYRNYKDFENDFKDQN